MSLNNSLEKSLITPSIFVFGFAFVLTWATSARDQEMVVATAANTAVLVVFVGATVQP